MSKASRKIKKCILGKRLDEVVGLISDGNYPGINVKYGVINEFLVELLKRDPLDSIGEYEKVFHLLTELLKNYAETSKKVEFFRKIFFIHFKVSCWGLLQSVSTEFFKDQSTQEKLLTCTKLEFEDFIRVMIKVLFVFEDSGSDDNFYVDSLIECVTKYYWGESKDHYLMRLWQIANISYQSDSSFYEEFNLHLVQDQIIHTSDNKLGYVKSDKDYFSKALRVKEASQEEFSQKEAELLKREAIFDPFLYRYSDGIFYLKEEDLAPYLESLKLATSAPNFARAIYYSIKYSLNIFNEEKKECLKRIDFSGNSTTISSYVLFISETILHLKLLIDIGQDSKLIRFGISMIELYLIPGMLEIGFNWRKFYME